MNNYQKLIHERRSCGELDHADDSLINLKNVSHLIVETYWKGDDVIRKNESLKYSFRENFENFS